MLAIKNCFSSSLVVYIVHVSMGGPSLFSQILKVAGVAQQQLDLLLEIEVGCLHRM